jgi:hypothetical protein
MLGVLTKGSKTTTVKVATDDVPIVMHASLFRAGGVRVAEMPKCVIVEPLPLSASPTRSLESSRGSLVEEFEYDRF